jgi:hypothetical protein
MPRSNIKIEKSDDFIIIEKDKNYEFLLSMSIIFYQKLMTIMQSNEEFLISMNPKFENLLSKINLKNETIKINSEELKLLIDWIDCLCLIMLDLDSIDLKNKDIQKYLKMSGKFILSSKKILNKN